MYGLEIRRQIRRRRGMLGYTMKDMAEGLGITHKSYSCMENGKRNLHVAFLEAIADVLKTTPEELYRNVSRETRSG
jgi:transcriptional regulator with XRE-family HTH domain